MFFLMQEKDIRYLVKSIWKGQSILSGEMEVPNLRLERWNISEHWAPWNCILLTDSESKIHREIGQVKEYYGVSFINSIEGKHIESKKHFENLSIINQFLKQSFLEGGGRIMI